jgi:hypothetical protein
MEKLFNILKTCRPNRTGTKKLASKVKASALMNQILENNQISNST